MENEFPPTSSIGPFKKAESVPDWAIAEAMDIGLDLDVSPNHIWVDEDNSIVLLSFHPEEEAFWLIQVDR